MEIYTVGHSTHSQQEFLRLLKDAGIEKLVDVRAFPGSRKFPHFHQDQLRQWLPDNGIAYQHCPHLGGRRRKSTEIDEALNDGWQNQSFHNYADYTLTAEFQDAIKQLQAEAGEQRIAICCSERHPARCHRLLISNWLATHGWQVKHIIDGPKQQTLIEEHQLGKWGAEPVEIDQGELVYPPEAQPKKS